MDITATVWTLLPPIIAIALALITKEVYSSLLIGILAGALLYTGFNPLHAVETTFEIMGGKLGDNINICIFLVLLGILVSLVTKSGASRAYGEWAVKTIKSRRGASFATSFLGIFIFVDDYFNCLTVGTVMRPVTDKYSITRAKLAYIIDATAAPVCIIAPISSWAAAVGSSLPESSTMDGFSLFMKTIPMNLYAILTLLFRTLVGERYYKMLETKRYLIYPIVLMLLASFGNLWLTGAAKYLLLTLLLAVSLFLFRREIATLWRTVKEIFTVRRSKATGGNA